MLKIPPQAQHNPVQHQQHTRKPYSHQHMHQHPIDFPYNPPGGTETILLLQLLIRPPIASGSGNQETQHLLSGWQAQPRLAQVVTVTRIEMFSSGRVCPDREQRKPVLVFLFCCTQLHHVPWSQQLQLISYMDGPCSSLSIRVFGRGWKDQVRLLLLDAPICLKPTSCCCTWTMTGRPARQLKMQNEAAFQVTMPACGLTSGSNVLRKSASTTWAVAKWAFSGSTKFRFAVTKCSCTAVGKAAHRR